MNFSDLRLQLTAVFEEAPEGGYTCSFEEFPDVFSEGNTLEEAKANLLDALQLVLAYHREEAHKIQSTNPFLREALELTAA